MELYEYQKEGVEFLKRKRRRYLADEMGLGKTVQAAVAAKELGVQSALIIVPASLWMQWKSEFPRWNDFTKIKVARYSRPYEFKNELADLIICDEAHYIKNPKAKRTKAVQEVLKKHKKAKKRIWFLSATPMPNDARELYIPITTVWPDVVFKQGRFNKLPGPSFAYWQSVFCKGYMQKVGYGKYFVVTDLKK